MPGRDAVGGLRDTAWGPLSEFIAATLGLHFPRERWGDLQRGLTGAAEEFGFEDVAACAGWLMSAPVTKAQLQVLASHLTIGETYFFREKKTFEVLASHVLPELIRARRGHEQRLRLWSAACCSGEEAYSLAILLHQALPNLAGWHVTILGTDINPHFLRKAAAGSYGEWSFRDVPDGFRERYFHRAAGGRHVIRPEIKALVRFEHLNLAEDVYPSLATDTNAMDLILCRNVLMYFTPAQQRKIAGRLHHALIDGGWLGVSPSEASQALFSQCITRNFPGVILYQRRDATVRESETLMPPPPDDAALWAPAPLQPWTPPAATALPPERSPAPYAMALSLYEEGRYGEAADALLALATARMPEPRVFSLLARALANQGRLADARVWCDRWIAAAKVDPTGHYLRAMVLLEIGEPDEARRSLQRALYVNPDFVLAHFALGTLARSRGVDHEADRHFANALPLLARLQPDEPLPESDGLTAARLIDTITAMAAPGQTG